MTDATKEKVKKIMREYIRVFPVEYEEFMVAQRHRQENKTTKFAEVNGGGNDQLVRHLIEIPESLNMALKMKLEQDEFDWLFGFNDYQGNFSGFSWFMKVFPQFNVSEEY